MNIREIYYNKDSFPAETSTERILTAIKDVNNKLIIDVYITPENGIVVRYIPDKE